MEMYKVFERIVRATQTNKERDGTIDIDRQIHKELYNSEIDSYTETETKKEIEK